jgi:hypothetical protein
MDGTAGERIPDKEKNSNRRCGRETGSHYLPDQIKPRACGENCKTENFYSGVSGNELRDGLETGI